MSSRHQIMVGGRSIALELKRNARAKRLSLRVERAGGLLKLTVPPGISERKALAFAVSEQKWVQTQIDKAVPIVKLQGGANIHFGGEKIRIIFDPDKTRGVWHIDGQIIVGGPVAHAPGRLMRWLKLEAKKILMPHVEQHASSLGVHYSRVSIGDMRSRWGSCSASGGLRFNWRLILAPPSVLNYVAAHEVAHLREMNHSKAFWAHVTSLVPDWHKQRRWLRKEGHLLLAVSK